MDSRPVALRRDKNDGEGGSPTITCDCGAQDRMTTFNKIMLGYRPIVPRPTSGGRSSGGLVIDEERAVIVSEQGTNRSFARVGRNINERTFVACGEVGRNSFGVRPQENRTEQEQSSWYGGILQCKCNQRLREKEKNKQEDEDEQKHPRIRLKLRSDASGTGSRSQGTNRNVGRVEVLATVWYVRETCMNGGEGLGRTNWERMKDLERDTCPGFVSDVLNRVQWVNGAFRKMVKRMEWQLEEGRKEKVEVRLEMQERIPYRAFTCQMKVQYRLGKEIRKPEIVPCDAWRMNGGGFAWRLDVQAALRLGL